MRRFAVDPALLTLVLESPSGAAAGVRAAGLLAAGALILERRHGDAVAWAGRAAIHTLRHTIVAEFGLAVVILMLTATLTTTSPPAA